MADIVVVDVVEILHAKCSVVLAQMAREAHAAPKFCQAGEVSRERIFIGKEGKNEEVVAFSISI